MLAMKKANISQSVLADRIGVSQPSIWKLVSGKTSTSRKLVDISRALNVRPEWLSSGEGPMYEPNELHHLDSAIPPENEWDVQGSKAKPFDDEVKVPLLRDIELATSDGSFCEDDHRGFKLHFSKAALRKVGANSNGNGILCFPAKGNSMEPVIPDGTTVAVNVHNKHIVDGGIYAINQDGLKRIKMLYRQPGGKIMIRSFNREYDDEEANENTIEIIGKVFWYSVLL